MATFKIPLPKGVKHSNPALYWQKYLVQMSGGKDSKATFLGLLESGVPLDRIELWHMSIDGHEDDYIDFFDWRVAPSYCEKIADHFKVPLLMAWRKNGLYQEMMRDQEWNQPVRYRWNGELYEIPISKQERYKISRMKFPQRASIRSGRYCSVKVKIDVARSILKHRPDLQDINVLVISGERAEESKTREGYSTFEPEMTVYSKTRNHWRWRPVHSWKEEQVWEIIRRHGIRPFVAYELGWGRTSCMFCIFGSVNQWATAQQINPERVQLIARMEREFAEYHLKNKDRDCATKKRCVVCERLEKMAVPAYTIHNKMTVLEMADAGDPYDLSGKEHLIKLAMSREYYEDVYVGSNWELPAGAYGESAGPT